MSLVFAGVSLTPDVRRWIEKIPSAQRRRNGRRSPPESGTRSWMEWLKISRPKAPDAAAAIAEAIRQGHDPVICWGLDLYRTPLQYYWDPRIREPSLTEKRIIRRERVGKAARYHTFRLQRELLALRRLAVPKSVQVLVAGSPHSLAPYDPVEAPEALALHDGTTEED